MPLVGATQGLVGALQYMIIPEFFETKYKIKAFFFFSMLQSLGDVATFLTPFIIDIFGWRVTWFIIGGFCGLIGILTLFTVREPSSLDEVTIASNDN